jgi:hypothetical protein
MLWALAVLGAGTTAGCGPVEYINQVTRRASASVAAARAAGADRNRESLYDYTLSVLYLNQARVEAGHAHYQVAIKYGQLSERTADDARQIALSHSGETPSPDDKDKPAEPAPPKTDTGDDETPDQLPKPAKTETP